MGSRWMRLGGAFAALVATDLLFVRGISRTLESAGGVRFLVNQLLSWLVLVALVVLLARIRGVRGRVLAFVALFLPLFVQDSHFFLYREFVSGFGLTFFFGNPELILTAGADVLPWWRPFVLAFVAGGAAWALVPPDSRRRWPAWLAGLGVVGGLPLLALHWYCFPTHQNAVPAFYAAFIEAGKTMHWSGRKARKVEVPKVASTAPAPNIIWVIGESLSAGHMSLFGYERPTTPHLSAMESRGELVAFRNATSIGTHTRISVPYMLTGIAGIDPNGLIFRQPTIFDYAAARGYHTGFLSAQDLKWGDMDQLLAGRNVADFKSGSSFAPNVSVHRGADDMVVLEKGVIPFLDSARRPFFLVVQMDGSHYPYSEHSPREFKKFLPEEKPNGLNAYDNTVLYSDHYFRRLLEETRRRDPSAWVFFVSDHGENLTNLDGMFHYRFSRNLIYVPLLVFPPADARRKLLDNRDAPVSQADIFATVLELMDMEPVLPIDGLSLLGSLPRERIRMVSAYMSTLEQDPAALVVLPDGDTIHLDFVRNNALFEKRKRTVPFGELDAGLKALFAPRLESHKE